MHARSLAQAAMALCEGGRGVILVTCLGAYTLSSTMVYQISVPASDYMACNTLLWRCFKGGSRRRGSEIGLEGPFFETYARETQGVSTVTVGWVFAAMPASSFLGSLLMDGMIRKRLGVGFEANMSPPP